MSNPIAKLDRSAVLAVLNEMASSVEKAEAYDAIDAFVAKNVELLKVDIARLRRSRAGDAKLKMAVLSGQLMAYKDIKDLFDKRDGE
jgi:hypothetical protein